MAAENRTGYFLAGLTVLAGVVAALVTLFTLGGGRGSSGHMLVETYYDKPISGLSPGSDVNFRGVKVGEVKEVSFVGSKYAVDGMDKFRIYILMAVDRERFNIGSGENAREFCRRLVKNGLRATVSASGITGISRVECDFRPGSPEPPPPKWNPEHFHVPSTPSLMESFSDAATRAMNQINRMDFSGTWSNVSESVSAATSTLSTLRNMLSSRHGDIERILVNLEDAAAALRDFAESVKRNPARLLSGDDPEPLPETSR